MYPETVDQANKRYRWFFRKAIDEHYEKEFRAKKQSKVVIVVGHGVPFQNAFLQMFEADKDCVFLDYCAVSIVERCKIPNQIDEWNVRKFGDASHIPGLGLAML